MMYTVLKSSFILEAAGSQQKLLSQGIADVFLEMEWQQREKLGRLAPVRTGTAQLVCRPRLGQ